MRIVQLVQKPQRRGAETFAWELSEWSRRQGHEVSTGYLYPHSGSVRLPLQCDDALFDGDERSRMEKVPGVAPRLLAKVKEFVADKKPDIVQLNGARTIKYGAALKLFSRGVSWKLVYRNIDSPLFWVRGASRKAFYRHLVMPQMDGVVGVSQKTLDEVRSFYGLKVPSVFIPNGVNFSKLDHGPSREEVRRELKTEPDAKVVLFFGNLTAQKRPDRFLRVFDEVAATSDNAVAWLVGDGPLRDDAEKLANELDSSGRVRFLGYKSDVAPYVRASDILLSTSDTEGIPAAVAEAAYCGLPTVGLDVGGMSECVRDNVTGFLAPAGDEGALASKLDRLLKDRALQSTMSSAAHEWAKERYSMLTVGARYLDFYRSLLT